MATTQWGLSQMVRRYAPILARKMAIIAVAWIAIYFISQPFRREGSMLMLFAPLVGALPGIVAGWFIAENAGNDSTLSGLVLWVILVIGAVLPMWITEGVMRMFTHWPMNFGGFMVMTGASIMGLASAVWHASSQE